MTLKTKLFIFIYCIMIPCIMSQNSLRLLTLNKHFFAGNTIFLEFKAESLLHYQMYCSNSYGSTLIDSYTNNGIVTFKIPSYLSRKTGVLNWKILNSKKPVFGQIKIVPQQTPKTIETYLGPTSIQANESDFSMIVAIPTDSLDNPLKEATKIILKKQFLSAQEKKPLSTKNLIVHQKIYAPKKSGRMILSSESMAINSKEYTLNIMPSIGTDFKIFSKRNHDYADGNQITTFFTSSIRDKNNNIISDGSFVDFFITNKEGSILKTSGTTINGIAEAKIIHPEQEEIWKIKAYIIGISESNTLTIKYKKAIKNFNIHFSKSNRNLTVGPLKSFMNQLIPDGLKVKLSIYRKEKLLDEIIQKSKDGFVHFYLDDNIYTKGSYDLEITVAGINKSFKSKKIW